MSDHAEKFAAFIAWAEADDDPEASWTMARWQAKALVSERDGLRARVEQLEAERDEANQHHALSVDTNRGLLVQRDEMRVERDQLRLRVVQLQQERDKYKRAHEVAAAFCNDKLIPRAVAAEQERDQLAEVMGWIAEDDPDGVTARNRARVALSKLAASRRAGDG